MSTGRTQTTLLSPRASNRRENRRMVNPKFEAEIDGKRYVTLDWSFGGLKLAGSTRHADYRAGVRVAGLLRLAEVRKSEVHSFHAVVVRSDAQTLAIRFEARSEALVEFMSGSLSKYLAQRG